MGETLTDAALLELLRFFDALDRVDALLADLGQMQPIASAQVRDVARAFEPGRAGSFGFYIADAFDQELAAVRADAARTQAELDAVRGRATATLRAALGRDDLGDEFIVMRDDTGGTVPAGLRVLREAPTYWLCSVEPDEATLDALARRDAVGARVAIAEERVRAGLSQRVADRAVALDAAAAALGDIDVLVAAARFAQAHRCVLPEIVDAPLVAFEAGRFLPLEGELERQGRAFTPIDARLDDMAVLTGPNMGGKSVCLRTGGFIALCAAFGLPVPAKSARVGLFDEIAWLGIGASDEFGGLLSSFAKEVVRAREILERDAPRAFVLIDEFARTTTPGEGRALLVALIARLRARGARGMAATHLAGVAKAAGVAHFAVRGLNGIPQRPPAGDLQGALAALSESMDYAIVEVTGDDAGAADALALAALLGLDAGIVDEAYRVLAAGG
jgi:hypothetical protein